MTSLRDPAIRLRQAVQDNNLSLVQRLRYKTPLRNTDSQRLTSLAWAALSGAEETFEWLLLDAGHDDDELSRDQENSTILHLLATLPSPLTPTTSKKPRDLQKAAVRMSIMYWEAFPQLIDWSNAAGKTALHLACQSGNAELVKTLCELGADYYLADLQGNTPLHYGSAWNQIECIRILLDYGCPPNVRNNQGFTALEYAYSTTLAREFQDAIRETYEGRRTAQQRRNEGSFTSVAPSLGGGMQVDSHGLRYRPSYGTLFSDDASTSGSYTGGAGRLGYGYQPPGTPQHLRVETATTPEPKSPGSTFSYVGENAGTNSNGGGGVGLGMGRVGSSSGTQSPMHRQVSQRAYQQNTTAGANYELISPGTTSPGKFFPRGTSPPPLATRRLSYSSSTSTPPAIPRQQSGLQVPEAPSPTTGRGIRPGEPVRPVSLLRQASSSGNRSPSAISPTHTGGSQWPRMPMPLPPAPRGYSASEVMARTESVRSAMESPSRKVSLGIPPALTRRESSPSVIEHPQAAATNAQEAPVLGPPV